MADQTSQVTTLSTRQSLFVAEYLVDLHATKAAIRAGYAPKYAGRHAHRMMQHPTVVRLIAEGKAERAKRLHLSQDEVLREAAILATSDVRHYCVGDDGRLALAEGAPEHAWRAVSSVKYRTIKDKDGATRHEIEYRLWDKPAAITLVGKHLGTWRDGVSWQGQLPPFEDLTDAQLEHLAAGGDPAKMPRA